MGVTKSAMINKGSVAIAVFVKTPGQSPIKTRLAAEIGRESAERFHYLSALCIENTITTMQQSLPTLSPYWAIAEESGLSYPAWKSFGQIYQGPGSLGEKLFYVYSTLLKKHEYVLLIGADSPQITPRDLLAGIEMLKSNAFVIGPTEDGGFYLFGGTLPITKEIWVSIPYSTTKTSEELSKKICSVATISNLSLLYDVDTLEDLKKLLLISKNNLSSRQIALLEWVDDLLFQ